MKKKRRRINFQKIFSFASFVFILVCIFWYGGRVIYFYNDSKKIITEESKTFARIIKTNNNGKDTFKLVDKTYYFTGMADSNYIEYSNMLWRIIKINSDNTVVVVSDSTVGTLPFGDDKSTYTDSFVLKWLNNTVSEEVYHLENKLNQKDKFLIKNKVCVDVIDSVENIDCNTKNEDYYLGLLSVQDYINSGGNGGFINNGKYSYLANQNTDNLIWYLNQDGKLDVTEKTAVFR